MMYECRNKIGEKIGVAHTKREAEEMIRHANWLLDQKRGTPEYEQRVARAQKAEEKENLEAQQKEKNRETSARGRGKGG